MADLLVFIPGILGTELKYVPQANDRRDYKLWVDPIFLATCRTNDLKVTAGGSGVVPLEPMGLYQPSYQIVLETLIGLTRSSPAEGFPQFGDLVTIAYDWRFTIRAIAESAAGDILAQHAAQKADKIRIVAHSMGGLVARGVYRVLKEAGKEGLIKRIVTCGTPHHGSTSPADTLIGTDEIITSIAKGKGSVNLGSIRHSSRFTTNLAIVVQAASTWPALYDLLPDPNQEPDNVPGADLLYSAASYPTTHQVSETELARAKGTAWPWLSDATYIPPADVLCMTYGTSYRTPNGCSSAGSATMYTPGIALQYLVRDGDSRVSVKSGSWSSLPDTYTRVEINTDHEGLVKDNRALKEIVALVVADIPPATKIVPGIKNPSNFGGYRIPPAETDPGPQAHVPWPNTVGQYGRHCDL